MRIAIITQTLSVKSGARAPLEIAKALSLIKGNHIKIYARKSQDPQLSMTLTKSGIEIFISQKSQFVDDPITLYKKLREDQPDIVVFAGTLPSFLVAKLTGTKIVRIYMGSQFDAFLEKKNPDESISLLDKVANFLTNIYIFLNNLISVYLSTAVVAISLYATREVQKFYKRRVDKVIYLGATKIGANTRFKNGLPNILTVSRITPYKGFHIIIETIKRLKSKHPVNLTIIGSQPNKKYLQYLKKISDSSVNLVIDPNDETLAKYYQNCNFYVTADKNLYFGLPICEAALFAKPTVALDLGAAREIIKHNQTGYVAKNPKEFTLYMRKLLKNPPLAQKMGKAAKVYVQDKFSWVKISQEYQRLLEKLV